MWILSCTLTICFATEPVGLQKGSKGPIFWIIVITEKRGLSIDNGKVIGTIFIDFTKAFDCVDDNILGYKLQACGITGSVWERLLSYLTNRLQFVKISGTKADLFQDYVNFSFICVGKLFYC